MRPPHIAPAIAFSPGRLLVAAILLAVVGLLAILLLVARRAHAIRLAADEPLKRLNGFHIFGPDEDEEPLIHIPVLRGRVAEAPARAGSNGHAPAPARTGLPLPAAHRPAPSNGSAPARPARATAPAADVVGRRQPETPARAALPERPASARSPFAAPPPPSARAASARATSSAAPAPAPAAGAAPPRPANGRAVPASAPRRAAPAAATTAAPPPAAPAPRAASKRQAGPTAAPSRPAPRAEAALPLVNPAAAARLRRAQASPLAWTPATPITASADTPAPEPAPPASRDLRGTRAAITTATAPSAPRQEGIREGDILLVEDDVTIAGMYQVLLGTRGYATRHAHDGLEGISMVRDRTPALILLDMMMPRMDGIQFLEALRGWPRTADIPVVVLSNVGDRPLVDRALALGAVEYLVKAQTRPQVLLGALPHWLRGNRALTTLS